jgi:hypothetical protein
MKLLVALVAMFAMSSISAADLKIQKVKTIGDLKHKVIFQSKDLKVLENSNVVYGKIVAAWGVNVYEVANAFYTCNEQLVCKFTKVKNVAMYESCTVKNNKAVCKNKISGNTYQDSGDVITENPDAVGTEFGDRDSSYGEYDSEFPVRIVDEFSGLF